MIVLKKTFQFIFSIYGFLIFLIGMFVLLPFFVIAFLQKPVRAGNWVISLARIWSNFFFFMTGIIPKMIYDHEPNPNKEYIFISNHISYIDIPMMMSATQGRKLRVLAKVEMAHIPIFGSIYKRGAVLLDRENTEERKKSVLRLIELINQKISVFLCPEGTFNKTHQPLKFFYDGAFRTAIETQKPIQPILFLDTYTRLNYNSIFSLNPGKCRAVFLKETPTLGLSEDDIKILKEKIFQQMEEALIKYRAKWIKA